MSAFIFYLDGTLVETERLKALPYTEVLGRLTGPNTPDGRAAELYERIVGSTVEIVCRQMIDEFNLASALGSSDLADGADSEHWKELHRLRMDEYRENHGALGRLQANAYQHNVDLLVPSEIDREGRFRGYIIVYRRGRSCVRCARPARTVGRCRDYRRFADRHTGCHGVGCRVDMREYRIFPSGN